MPVNADGVGNGVSTEATDLIAGKPSDVIRVAPFFCPDVSSRISGSFELVAIIGQFALKLLARLFLES